MTDPEKENAALEKENLEFRFQLLGKRCFELECQVKILLKLVYEAKEIQVPWNEYLSNFDKLVSTESGQKSRQQ